jgi:hypothetical protein
VVRVISSEGFKESGFLKETRILALSKRSKLMTCTTSTSRRKYPYHLEFEFSPLKRTFSIQRGTYSLRAG